MTAPFAGLLCGYGLFKARECIIALFTEKNDELLKRMMKQSDHLW